MKKKGNTMIADGHKTASCDGRLKADSSDGTLNARDTFFTGPVRLNRYPDEPPPNDQTPKGDDKLPEVKPPVMTPQDYINKGIEIQRGKSEKEAAKIAEQKLLEMGVTQEKLVTWKKLEEEAADQQKKKLIDQGQFEKLQAESKRQHTEEVTKLSEQNQNLNGRLKNFIRSTVLTQAAMKHKAIDPTEVMVLAANSVRVNDDDTVTVIDSTGQELLTQAGKSMTVDDFMAKFLSERPHLQGDPIGKGGSGSPKRSGGSPDKPVFTKSQIKDGDFYKANRDAILDAQAEKGNPRIVDG